VALLRHALSRIVFLPPEAITERARLLEDLGLDSLEQVELAIELEDRLGVIVTDSAAERLRTVGDVADYTVAALGELPG
jgi:acyl carrier protein